MSLIAISTLGVGAEPLRRAVAGTPRSRNTADQFLRMTVPVAALLRPGAAANTLSVVFMPSTDVANRELEKRTPLFSLTFSRIS